MPTIQHHFAIAAEPIRIYRALTEQSDLRNWWVADAKMIPAVGAIGEFFWKGPDWRVKVRVEKLEPGKLVEWRCTASNIQNTEAWAGTRIRFAITSDSAGSRIEFEQGAYPDSPCFGESDALWVHSIGTSLKQYLETGTALPYRG